MSRTVRMIAMIIMLSTLAACKTTMVSQQDDEPRQPDPKQEAKRLAETAKINAQLGMAYLERKNLMRAKQKLLMALKQGPGIPETWYSMAYFLEATGNKVAAREYYIKAIKVAPERGDAHNNYGTYLCRSGQYRESVKHFLAAAKSTTYLEPAAAYENAGLCAMNIPDYKNAARYFKQALEEDPSRNSSLISLAEAEYKMGHYKNAKENLKKYSLLAKPSGEMKTLLAKIEKRLG